jgi:hypothetical protein
MQNIQFWKIRLGGVIDELMPYPLGVKKKRDLVETLEIPTIESEFFWVLGSLDNSKFLEIFILLPFFNDGNFSWVNKRHPYEMDEIKTTQKGFG